MGFKQNIGHCGTNIVIGAVHGNNKTMKAEWPREFEDFWDRLAMQIKKYNVKFLAGDFNMALT